jgi:hypothetical protein
MDLLSLANSLATCAANFKAASAGGLRGPPGGRFKFRVRGASESVRLLLGSCYLGLRVGVTVGVAPGRRQVPP